MPAVAVTPNGDVVATWEQNLDGAPPSKSWVASYDAQARSWTVTPLLGETRGRDVDPLVAANQAGEVVIVWQHIGEARSEIWMTRSGPR